MATIVSDGRRVLLVSESIDGRSVLNQPAGHLESGESLAQAAVRETLTDAIAAGGSSVRDYVHSDGGAGSFQLRCAVYDRAGRPCPRCGATIRQVRQAGRSTFHCPACQR